MINRRTILTGAAVVPFAGVAGAASSEALPNRFNQLINQIDSAEKELREMIELNKYDQHFKWSNPVSTPIEDVRGALRKFEKLYGVKPNRARLILSPEKFEILCDHPDILDIVRYGQGQKVYYYANRPSVEKMGESMAELFGVQIEIKSVKSFEIINIDTGAVKTLWFQKDEGAFLHYFDWDELSKYYERVAHS